MPCTEAVFFTTRVTFRIRFASYIRKLCGLDSGIAFNGFDDYFFAVVVGSASCVRHDCHDEDWCFAIGISYLIVYFVGRRTNGVNKENNEHRD